MCASPAPPQAADFFECCAQLLHTSPATRDADFPLQPVVELRSASGLNFASAEVRFTPGAPDALPRMDIPFLTFAGVQGPLPMWVSECLQNRTPEARAMHRFMDVLNRRIWELLFMAHLQGSRAHLGQFHTRGETGLAEMVRLLVRSPLAPSMQGAALVPARARWERGPGRGEHVLQQSLSRAFGSRVWFGRFLPVRLPIATACKARLGSLRLGETAVIGDAARIACGVRTFIDLTRHAPLVAGRQHLQQILAPVVAELHAAYRHNMPPLRLRVAFPALDGATRLGNGSMRLGHGAQLRHGARLTQLLDISDLYLNPSYRTPAGRPAPPP